MADGDTTRLIEPRTDSLADISEAVMNGGDVRLGDGSGSGRRARTAADAGQGRRHRSQLSGRTSTSPSVETPERPLVFAKFPSSVIGPGAPIVVDTDARRAGRLGGRARDRHRPPDAHGSRPSDALDYVFGYTVANDVSARDVQFGDGQWTRGKSLDTFCPLGPVVVTADELGPVDDLRLTTKVNGELMQDDSTAQHDLRRAASCSRSARAASRSSRATWSSRARRRAAASSWTRRGTLSPGDVVEVAIEGIGSLTNPVVGPGSES